MGELFAEIGDLVFTLVIGYISAIEFLYVVRHLYHYSCNHDADEGVDSSENMSQLQDSMRKQLATAKNKETKAGTQVMKDGIPYKDGFRMEAQQTLIDQLKEQLKDKELSDLRRQELEEELAKQTKIAEKLRKELNEAEAKYHLQLKQEEEAKAKKILDEQKQREREEHAKKEAAEEQARRLAETEKQKEAEQRNREEEEERRKKEAAQKEIERKEREQQQQLKQAEEQAERQRQQAEYEENARILREAEMQREKEQRILEEEQKAEQEEAEENARRLLEIEKAKKQRQAAEEEAAELAAKNLLEIEHRLEEQLRAAEREGELTEKEHQLIDSIKSRDLNKEEGNDHKEAELLRKILEAREQLGEESEEEQSLRLIQRERDQEAKQKRIEENALLFLEAEKEMADLQSKMLDAVEKRVFPGSLDSAPQTPVVEELCIRRSFSPLSAGDSSHSTVKTQLAQDLKEPYLVRTKPLLFPGVSDDASSIDPASSQKSSFSTQPSEEITTGTDSQYPAQERQEPDGEDTAINLQYSDDYLRSLDGIKQRPLVREDGSGRRRAFKKRRSSNSSNSSRESRHSRDEELKMFTSLEEEEMKDTADTEFTPIRYTTEPTLKVKAHHRRHKRSPAKDMRRGDDSLRSSLERLGEETSDPWGEVKPEQYKNTEFWKREKTLSIDEETEFEKPASSEEVAYETATNLPSASSFEEATQKQNQEALSALRKHSPKIESQKENSGDQAAAKEEPAQSDNTNLQTSQTAEKEVTPNRSSASPRLRRSPRIEEINQYEERWKETTDVADSSAVSTAQNTPTINVETPLDFGSWRDEHGLIMEGLSDFYDFTASVNPSRSRSVSRNVSPANTAPSTPLPKDVTFHLGVSNEKTNTKDTVEIYDDTEVLDSDEFKKENIIKFIDSLSGNESQYEEKDSHYIVGMENAGGVSHKLQYVADDFSKATASQINLVPLVNIIDEVAANTSPNLEENESVDTAMNTLVSSLRSQQTNRSRSRSKSPLPTPDNLKRSVENRRYKMIKHNEDILEKLIESKLLPDLTPPEEMAAEEKTTKETETKEVNAMVDDEDNSLIETLQVDKRRSRSKSPMRLPTPENLSKGLEKRRSKLIERNDELIKQLEERSLTPESPTIVVEHLYEIEAMEERHSTSTEEPISPTLEEEEECSREKMDLLVQSLRVARSRTRSKSPNRLQEKENLSEITESETLYSFKYAEYTEANRFTEILNVPTISFEVAEAETETKSTSPKVEGEEDCSREQMDLLINSLRVARSRSPSKSPLLSDDNQLKQHMKGRSKTPEPFASEHEERSRHSRSKSPSRSHSPSPGAAAAYRSNTPSRSISPHPEDDYVADPYIETSISSEEHESLHLYKRQRQLDEEALEKLRNASEEVELRTLSPLEKDELSEQQSRDYLAELPVTERSKLLKKSPTTPDYDRAISEEMRDVERIKQEMLKKGFKRSTYVGESLDLGSEFESLRKEAAKFQRSRSPSPSFSAIASATAQKSAEENRKLQDLILQELTTSSTTETKECKSTGAIPKTERYSSCEIELSLTNELEDTKRIREELLNSSFLRSEDKTDNFAELRRRNAEFRRSASTSRSPLRESQLGELASIEVEAANRVFKDKVLDEVSCNAMNFQNFSRFLNTNFLDNDRRASDSALIKVPEILLQNKDDLDMEPEEYHHFRRFSLAQEEPVEQYPADDYIFVQQVEVRTRSGSRTWLREDFYSENVAEHLERGEQYGANSAERDNIESAEIDEHVGDIDQQNEDFIFGAEDDEEYSNASDDDRQTVVEVDDEIDEDISDFKAEESHHETSECEEAEREMDRYAGREASDWNQVANVNDVLINENLNNEMVNTEMDEGAVGGLSNSPYDSDSFTIDQIYDDAIKNRKQSGILREYDSILMQMSINSDIDEQYLLWSKTSSKRIPKSVEFGSQFLHSELKDSEMRYLGDSNITARQSARLRSRYGYNPVLLAKNIQDDLQVDMNYKPKREYNWRKNFKLDEDVVKEDKEITLEEIFNQDDEKCDQEMEQQWEEIIDNEQKEQMMIDARKFSLGGESVTLFSCSPEKSMTPLEAIEDLKNDTLTKEVVKEQKVENMDKPKKKKTKKKSHKESKASLEENMNREDEDAYDNLVYSRRSSIQLDTDSPKRKSRSRRSSKSSINNEDSLGLFSPRSSIAYSEPITDIMEEISEQTKETVRPKKIKKRKKVKETMANVVESPIENKEELQYNMEPLNDIPTVSAEITPESSIANILSTLSPQNSVCVTPASIENNVNLSTEELREHLNETTTPSSSTTDSNSSRNLSRTSSIITTTVDTFDILKDANFYPLF